MNRDLTREEQVFVMRGTNEVFTDYEKYLKRYFRFSHCLISTKLTRPRLDYLTQASLAPAVSGTPTTLTMIQKKFVDAVNGKSGLTCFEALESEV